MSSRFARLAPKESTWPLASLTRLRLPALVALSLLALGAGAAAAVASARASAAGPEVLNCAKREQPASCLEQNMANRLAFNQIKDHPFTGVRGDGDEVEQTFCADAKFESRSTDSTYGAGISKGSSWKVVDARVSQGGKSITAFVEATGGFEVALVRQAAQWKLAVASLGRVLDPGPATRTWAAATCAAL